MSAITYVLATHSYCRPVYVTWGLGWSSNIEDAKTWTEPTAKALEYYRAIMGEKLNFEIKSQIKKAA